MLAVCTLRCVLYIIAGTVRTAKHGLGDYRIMSFPTRKKSL